jgi:hypothetical protein
MAGASGFDGTLSIFHHGLDMLAAKPAILGGYIPRHNRNECHCTEDDAGLRTSLLG